MQAKNEQSTALIDRLVKYGHRELVEWQGRQVCWRVFGSGPPLVLVHGGHGSWLHWVRNIEALAARHTVWVVDLPGYGDSDATATDGNLLSVLEPTLGTMNHLIGADLAIDLVGFSFGGLVAAHLAARRSRVRHLALLGPAGLGGQRRPRGELHSWKAAAKSGDSVTLEAVMRHNLSVHMLHASAQEVDALAVHIHTEACVHTRFRSKDISRAGGLLEVLLRRYGPTLLAWGEHDVTADTATIARALLNQVPGCQTHVVEGAGHWVQYERADEINSLLLAWLRSDLEN